MMGAQGWGELEAGADHPVKPMRGERRMGPPGHAYARGMQPPFGAETLAEELVS
jgi:hypothetical protein